ncbi:VPLPA-CTERM sorting domain-containing protein [Sulfurirhabdus autotrophica]|uniref:Putative secreted protein n=1 Tax=Sulfurirhabdus autotrophica TaxID=1706046 RepID=A0A4V6P3X1_9PROT|nr:VPLPA-CTERM sorting domain-containing protein [Sulfurirhabdus autotrophica]TCV86779.1 putative secreted protein [Sulfurirhabdus autotrophica]
MNSLNISRIFLLLSSIVVSAAAQASSADQIVGSWLLDNGSSFSVATFLQDGRYVDASAVAGDPAHTGIEWGTYSWNPVSGAITATSTGDTNGNWGIANDVDGTQYLTVSGNAGTIFQNCGPSCTGSVNRILPSSPQIVGSWLFDSSGTQVVTTFLQDGRYMEASVVAGDPTHTGIEWGTYSWNSSTGAITATSAGDTNGNWGIANDVDGTQYFTVSGNTGTMFQNCGPSCTGSLNRILPASVPVPAAAWLMGSGLLGLIGVARKRKAA